MASDLTCLSAYQPIKSDRNGYNLVDCNAVHLSNVAITNSNMKWTNFKNWQHHQTITRSTENDCFHVFIGSLWPGNIEPCACGALFLWQSVLAVAEGLKSSCCCALPVGVDLCCHCLCHCLCGQTVKLALSLLAEYYNTANASSDPWNLPSIEMNHTDGRFVIQQNCPSTRPPANIARGILHCIRNRINQVGALQVHLRTWNIENVWTTVLAYSEGFIINKHSDLNTYFSLLTSLYTAST